MRPMLVLIAAGFASSIAASAFAADAQPAVMTQPVSQTDDRHKVVCHHLIHEGVLLPALKCQQQLEWDRERLETQRALLDLQQRSLLMNR